MESLYYRNTECCVLVCDLTDSKSFESVESWRTEFLKKLNKNDQINFPFVLFANKCDKVDERKVESKKIKDYCESKNNMTFFETSAKENINIEIAFEEVAKLAYKRFSKNDKKYITNRYCCPF